MFCYALLLPTIACGVGKFLFGKITTDPLKRALLGGAATILAKGVCVVYYKYNQISRSRNSIILNFDDFDEEPCCRQVMEPKKFFYFPDSEFFKDGNELCCLRSVLCAKRELLVDNLPCAKSRQFGCEHAGCSEVIVNESDYQAHCLSNHAFKCMSCKRAYPSAHLLDLHIAENHNPMQIAPSFRCFVPSCLEVFSLQSDRRDHYITVHNFPPDFRYDTRNG
ncbi:Zinc finger protein 511 [Trichuris trichiura]|uniref:Zinc finger protein 511 n=1 Tax=Trichuris trichiura TaxID=36087 RepID=A0A077YXG1_TRITR|nr:Zinc finger protein 511 [Trichuris trichiura]